MPRPSLESIKGFKGPLRDWKEGLRSVSMDLVTYYSYSQVQYLMTCFYIVYEAAPYNDKLPTGYERCINELFMRHSQQP